jgi:hypothetical protein
VKTEGKRTKPMVDGMYARHPLYKGRIEEEDRIIRQNEQHLRCESKRQANSNGLAILDYLGKTCFRAKVSTRTRMVEVG